MAPSTKLPEEALRSLDISSLGYQPGMPPVPQTQDQCPARPDDEVTCKDDEEAEPDCPICQDALSRGPTITTECNHTFHVECLDAWKAQCERAHNVRRRQPEPSLML